jgi:hypothetical protein
VPDDQFQFDAKRHAELATLVAVESRFGRQHRPAVALVVREFRPAVALIVGEFWSAIACRQLRVAFR